MARWIIAITVTVFASAAWANQAPAERQQPEFDFASAALTVSAEYSGGEYTAYAQAEIDRMVKELSQQLDGLDGHDAIVDTLNNYIFNQQTFRRRASQGRLAPQGVFLDQVIHYRRGQCMGMSLLYLALADRLELPIYGVFVPDHFFVRYEAGEYRRNIDPSFGGRSLNDQWYIRAKNIPAGDSGAIYLRSLAPVESLGFLFHMRGVLKSGDGNFSSAMNDHDIAQRLFDLGGETAVNMQALSMNFKGDVHAARAVEAVEADPVATYEQEELALELYHRAIELDRRFGPSYLNRAFVFRSRGDLDSAIYECTRAIEQNPNYLRAYFWRATYYFLDGRYTEALADFERLELEGVDSPFYDIATEYTAMLREQH